MLTDPDQDGVHARLQASPGRRGLALVILYGLAGLLFWLGIQGGSGALGIVVLLVLSVVVIGAAEKMRQGTGGEIQLTDTALRHSDGTVIAALDDVAEVTRGAFALKPSNGFTLILRTPHTRAWRPGFWWRFGRRVGVGGIVPAGAARFMAEQIALRLASR